MKRIFIIILFFLVAFFVSTAQALTQNFSYDLGSGNVGTCTISVVRVSGGWNFTLNQVNAVVVSTSFQIGWHHRLGFATFSSPGQVIFWSDAQQANTVVDLWGMWRAGASQPTSVKTLDLTNLSQPQTITITPPTITVNEGESVNFIVSGAHTPLILSTPQGGYGNPPTLTFEGYTYGQFETDNNREFNITVYAQASDDYAQSNTVTGKVIVMRSLRVTKWLPANKLTSAVIYRAYQGGVVIATHTQVPGAPDYLWTITTTSNAPVTFDMTLTNVKDGGGTYITEPGTNTTIPDPSPSTPTLNPSTPSTNPTPQTPALPVPGQNTPVVWNPGNGGPEDLLTNQVYREGVERLMQTQLPPVPDQSAEIEQAVTAGSATSLLNDAQDIRDNLEAQHEALSQKKPLIPTVAGSDFVYVLPMGVIASDLTIDLSFLSTPISLMRLVIKLAFLAFMWFLYMRTLRASQV